MALDSQVGNLASISGGDLTGLIHEIYAGTVKPNVRIVSPTSQLFMDAGRGQYRVDGEKLVGSADLTYAGGAMHTAGDLPDHQEIDAVEWNTAPSRAYVRRAIDNLEEQRGRRGPGSFADYGGRLFDQMWDAFKRLQVRSAIGGSDAIVCIVDARDSGTAVTVKDGYNHTGTHPLLHLEPGMVIGWIDTNDSNNEAGAAIISSIDYGNKQITIDSNTTWEPGNQIAAGDYIVMATTNNISTDYFDTEFQNACNGLLDIVDPDQNNTTVMGISQSSYPRWKPYIQASSTFDHLEVTEHFRQLRAKSTDPVTAQTHICVAQGAVVAELARTLVGFQQQQNLGRTFEGGYQAVRIAGMDFIEDDYQLHDVLYTLCLETLFNVPLEAEADIYSEDGSQYSRLADFDGKEWYVRDYRQYFSDRRNRHGALTSITLSNVTADDFTPVPDY